MSLSPDQKLVNLTQYKELAAKVGVARYGSKIDLVSRIKGASGGKDKLQTLIEKTKKSIVVHKKKKVVVGSPKKKTPTKSSPKGGCDRCMGLQCRHHFAAVKKKRLNKTTE